MFTEDTPQYWQHMIGYHQATAGAENQEHKDSSAFYNVT